MGEARALLEQNVKAWNDHDSAGWMGDFSPDAEPAAPGVSGSGTDMARLFYSVWPDAFPDNQVRPFAIFEDGGTAVLAALMLELIPGAQLAVLPDTPHMEVTRRAELLCDAGPFFGLTAVSPRGSRRSGPSRPSCPPPYPS